MPVEKKLNTYQEPSASTSLPLGNKASGVDRFVDANVDDESYVRQSNPPAPATPINKPSGTDRFERVTIEDGLGGTVKPKPQTQTPVRTLEDVTGKSFDSSAAYSEYAPNSEGKANTGSGIEAALETGGYSWNKDAATKATNQYQIDVLNKKQELLANRQTMESNAVNYQSQTDMAKYSDNQNAEKVGWTGGYVLDQNRQQEYLKASIQAQMYGAMELQKYGYDTSLAAARLSYDMNQAEYAQKYYDTAVSQALSEAQLTGTYFSAEVKDMMSQLKIAEANKDNQELSEDERLRANKVAKSITDWFGSNKISYEGVKTLAAWQAEQDTQLQYETQLWNEYNAALESMKQDIADDANVFIQYTNDNKIYYENGEVKTIDLSTFNSADLKAYAERGSNAKAQVGSYLKAQAEQAKIDSRTYDKEGNITTYNDDKLLEKLQSINDQYKDIFGTDIPVTGYEVSSDQDGKVSVKMTEKESSLASMNNYLYKTVAKSEGKVSGFETYNVGQSVKTKEGNVYTVSANRLSTKNDKVAIGDDQVRSLTSANVFDSISKDDGDITYLGKATEENAKGFGVNPGENVYILAVDGLYWIFLTDAK